MFKLKATDFVKGLIVAFLSGVLLPVSAAIQTPGFDLTNANWHGIAILAINGGAVGFVSYLAKAFFSDEQGKVFGKIG
jgi:hypothetical protein